MSTLAIKTYPHPVLRQKAGPIKEVNQEIKKLAQDLIEAMKEGAGAGLAGPQAGVSQRIFVLDIGKGPVVFINPKIVQRQGWGAAEEGCLSLPGIILKIKRAKKIKCRFLDVGGKSQELEAEGLLARVIQHENDHLDGVLIIDKVGFLRRRQILKKYNKDRLDK